MLMRRQRYCLILNFRIQHAKTPIATAARRNAGLQFMGMTLNFYISQRCFTAYRYPKAVQYCSYTDPQLETRALGTENDNCARAVLADPVFCHLHGCVEMRRKRGKKRCRSGAGHRILLL